MVQQMDEGVGSIIATLRRLGLERETFVFFCSDNGATRTGDNGPLHGFKGSVWEGGHRVPAIAWWPGRISPGTTDQTAMSMDLLPTLLDLAGATAPAGRDLDGQSLAPLLLEGQALSGRTLFWAYNDRYAVRQGPWKLIVNQPEDRAKPGKRKAVDAPVSLFHLGEDPGEDRDLAPRNPAKVAELREALAVWKQHINDNQNN